MALKKLSQEEVEYSVKGLTDGGKQTVKCSNCRVPLVEVLTTRPNEQSEWNIQAKCPHCGDKSFKLTVKGGFHLGHTDYTDMISFDSVDDDTILVETAKGRKVWQ